MYRFVVLAVLASAFIPAAALARESDYEKYLARGVAAIEQQQYNDAAEEFRAALTERPDDPAATLYLGTTLSRAGDPGAAVVLKKALELNPKDPRANLERGIDCYRRTEYKTAAEYFVRTKELAPDTELAEKAERYLKAARQGGEKDWSAAIQAGIQYDSNVVLNGIDGLLPEGISRKSDWRLVLNLKARYMLVRQRQGEIWIGYSGYQSLHNRLQKFNVSRQQLEAGSGYNLSPAVKIGISYAYEYDLVGGADFNAAHAFSPSVTVNEGRGFSTVLSYGYRRNHYMYSGLFSDNQNRSGSGSSLGVTQQMRFGDAVEFRAGYLYAVESTRKAYWDFRSDQGLADMRVNLPRQIAVTLGGAYEQREYRGIYPLTTEKRQDRTSTVSVTATKVLSDQLSVTLGQVYIRNRSNIVAFDYKRAVSSLFLNVRF